MYTIKCLLLIEFALYKWLSSMYNNNNIPLKIFYVLSPTIFKNKSIFNKLYIGFYSISIPYIIVNTIILIFKGINS